MDAFEEARSTPAWARLMVYDSTLCITQTPRGQFVVRQGAWPICSARATPIQAVRVCDQLLTVRASSDYAWLSEHVQDLSIKVSAEGVWVAGDPGSTVELGRGPTAKRALTRACVNMQVMLANQLAKQTQALERNPFAGTDSAYADWRNNQP